MISIQNLGGERAAAACWYSVSVMSINMVAFSPAYWRRNGVTTWRVRRVAVAWAGDRHLFRARAARTRLTTQAMNGGVVWWRERTSTPPALPATWYCTFPRVLERLRWAGRFVVHSVRWRCLATSPTAPFSCRYLCALARLYAFTCPFSRLLLHPAIYLFTTYPKRALSPVSISVTFAFTALAAYPTPMVGGRHVLL